MTRRSLFLASSLALMAIGCLGAQQRLAKGERADSPARVSSTGIGFRLSDAAPETGPPTLRQVAVGSPMATSEAEQLFARLPTLVVEEDALEFSLPEGSLPPPRPGTTIQASFSPLKGGAPLEPSQQAPLRIERFSPEGEVPLAPSVSLTFSEPMIAITSAAKLSGAEIPARISPEPEGAWAWLGTRTLVFHPEKRLPMATEFTVTVPAGTKAMSGQTLDEDLEWSFTTPPPTLKRWLPKGSSAPLEPVIFAEFDQAIDPEAMLRNIELVAGEEDIVVRLATKEEIDADGDVHRAVERAVAGRWLALRPTRELPGKTRVKVRIAVGAQGTEGPLATAESQAFDFETFGPLELLNASCGWRGECLSSRPFELEFSNNLDVSKLKPEMFRVSPNLENMTIQVYRNEIKIYGKTKGDTEYEITVDGGLVDARGLELGETVSISIRVAPSPPRLFDTDRGMVILDPAGRPEFVAYSLNEGTLRAQVYAVTPGDWRAFDDWRRWGKRPDREPPGNLVSDEIIHPEEAPEQIAATTIDLTPALENGLGHAIVRVLALDEPRVEDQLPRELRVWVQSTRLGITGFVEKDRATAWVTDLLDGTPLDGVAISLGDAGESVLTKDGLATVSGERKDYPLVARLGKDSSFIGSSSVESFMREPTWKLPRWFVFDDRGVYKPGEEVYIKGWVRVEEWVRGGGLSLASTEALGEGIQYRVFDPRRVELASGRLAVDERGGFDFSFELPKNSNLGRAQVELDLVGSSLRSTKLSHAFSIQSFRKPEFEVKTRLSEGPHFAGGEAIASTHASYYAGGGLPGAPIQWSIRQGPASFTPPGHGRFHFGPVSRSFSWHPRRAKDPVMTETWSSNADDAGNHHLKLDFDALEPPYPMRLSLTSRVTDLNRQELAAGTSTLVHPSNRYVGMRLVKNFVRMGEALAVDLVVTDLDGALIGSRPVEIRAARISASAPTEAEEEELEVQHCERVSTTKRTPIRCSFSTKNSGRYRITAVVSDEYGKKNQSAIEAWDLGEASVVQEGIKSDKAMVILDKDEYLPGETATVLITSPFTPAEGLLTVDRSGIIHLERFTMRESSKTLEIKLEDSMVPKVELIVNLVGSAPRERSGGEIDPSLPRRPASARGFAKVAVLPSTRTLEVQAIPAVAMVSPGGSTNIEIEVRDPSGRPVEDAQVAVVVVDEAVLALSNYQTPDPVSSLYTRWPQGVLALHSRKSVVLTPTVNLGSSMGERSLGLGGHGRIVEPRVTVVDYDESELARDGSSIYTRADLSSLALFAPRVRTDAKGRANVPVKLPDNLTRYRVMAVAAAGENFFGSTESSITARLPLMVRPSAPRFLNYGDTFELSVLLQNQTDAPVDAAVVARATNASIGESAKKVTVPANDRIEVRFPVTTQKVGNARFQFGVSAPGFADAIEVEVPVSTPATTEAFATYGELDVGATAQAMELPEGVYEQFGGLEIATSSTQLQSLTDAVLYLAEYPFDCREQVASRVLAIASLRDVLSAFQVADLPPPEELEASIEEDIQDLVRTQHSGGGWSFWPGQRETWPIVSIHVAHALVRAKEKGYEVSAATLERAAGYLRKIEEHTPDWYSEGVRRSLRAYAFNVRWRAGDAGPEEAAALIAEAGGVEQLSLEALGWLWPALSGSGSHSRTLGELRRHVSNRVTETAGAAHFVTSYGDQDWVLLHSSRRTDGVLLEALIADQPNSTLIPKLVKGLLGHRKAGRWLNTQENAFVLLALERYFNEYEKVSPDFVARLWLGESYVGEHSFRGHTDEQSELRIPMPWLVENASAGRHDLLLGKDGPGRLYYRIGMSYAPTDLELPPLDRGFTVSRSYEGADDPGDVERGDDGSWRIRLGARVRVRVSMVAPARRQHVALVDPLPAGLEPLNPALAVTGALPKDPKAEQEAEKSGWWRWLWSRTWYEHQNLRDDRAEAFASLLYSGVWEYSYLTTATTPGTFVAPPTKAEEMYSPETFGRGTLDRVIVLER